MPSDLHGPAGLALLALAATTPAQTTHLVGPGGHPQITSAIAVASAGDTILVQPGTYSMFTLNLPLTIRAAVPGTVHVTTGAFCSLSPPNGTSAHFVGLRLGATVLGSGRLTMDACRFDPANSGFVVGNCSLHLQDCVFQPGTPFFSGGLPALTANNAEVTIVDSTIHGPAAGPLSYAGVGIRLGNSRLRLSHSTVSGGSAFGVQPAAVALEADAASTVWLADSSFTADPSLCPIAAANGRHERCVLSPNCGTLPSGQVLGIHQPAPLQNGALYSLEFTTTPNAAVGVFLAPTLATASHPMCEQTLLLPGASAFSGGVVVADATGLATGLWFVPPGPQFVGLTAWFQAFSGPALPLQASAVVGGVVR